MVNHVNVVCTSQPTRRRCIRWRSNTAGRQSTTVSQRQSVGQIGSKCVAASASRHAGSVGLLTASDRSLANGRLLQQADTRDTKAVL
jgi:hypothetical protein